MLVSGRNADLGRSNEPGLYEVAGRRAAVLGRELSADPGVEPSVYKIIMIIKE